MKAQAATEYLIIFGFSLLIIGVLWTTSRSDIDNTRWDLQRAYAKNALERITQTADVMYVQGQPAQMYINVDFPDNVNAVYIQDNAVAMELKWNGMLRNLTEYSISNLTGAINPAPGRHKLLLVAGYSVSISES